jgi:hypothetical protein
MKAEPRYEEPAHDQAKDECDAAGFSSMEVFQHACDPGAAL